MIGLQIPLDALRAELASIERELFPGLEADYSVSAYFELQAALLATEAAVRLDKLLRGVARFFLPTSRRFVVRVRAKLFRKVLEAGWRLSHVLPLSCEFVW